LVGGPIAAAFIHHLRNSPNPFIQFADLSGLDVRLIFGLGNRRDILDCSGRPFAVILLILVANFSYEIADVLANGFAGDFLNGIALNL
jgi:hypothetical protein